MGILPHSWQALARLRFSNEVITEDVDEALRLVEVSKASLQGEENRRSDHTPSSKIYNLIRSMAASGAASVGEGELDLRRVRERVLAKGFTADQFESAIDEYAMLDVSANPCPPAHPRCLPYSRLFRFGKLPLKEPGLFLLSLVLMMRIWMNFDQFIRGVHMTASRVMVSESLYFYETLDIKIPQHIFI